MALSNSFQDAVLDSSSPISFLQSLWQCFSVILQQNSQISMSQVQKRQIQLLRQYAGALEAENKTRMQQIQLLQYQKTRLIEKNKKLRSKINKNNDMIQPEHQHQLKMIEQIEQLYAKIQNEERQIIQIQENNKRMKNEIQNGLNQLANQFNKIQQINNNIKILQEQNQYLKCIQSNLSHEKEDKELYQFENELQTMRNQIKHEEQSKMAVQLIEIKTKYEEQIKEKQLQLKTMENRLHEAQKINDQSSAFQQKILISDLRIKQQYCARLRQDYKNQVRQLEFISANQEIELIKNQCVTYELQKCKFMLAEKRRVEEKLINLIQAQRNSIAELETKIQGLRQQADQKAIQSAKSCGLIKKPNESLNNWHRSTKILEESIQRQNQTLKQVALKLINSNKELQNLFVMLVNHKQKEGENQQLINENHINKNAQVGRIQSKIGFLHQYDNNSKLDKAEKQYEKVEKYNMGNDKKYLDEKNLKLADYKPIDQPEMEKQLNIEYNESMSERVQRLKKQNEKLGLKGNLEAKIRNLKQENRELRKTIFQ